MKLAITGASGFIGRNFLTHARDHFEEVRSLARKRLSPPAAIEQIQGTLADRNSLDQLTRGVDAVLHCAFDNSYRENISGLQQLLAACQRHKVRRLVHLSSYVVYDFQQSQIDEQTEYARRKDLYTCEKIQLEQLLRNSANPNFSIAALQPTVVFGPTSNWSNSMFLAAKHRQISLPKQGANLCHAIYIDDLVELLRQQLQTESATPFETRILSNLTTTWNDFLQFHVDLLRRLGHPVNEYQLIASSASLYSDSPLKDFVFRNSGAFPWKQLLAPLVRRKSKDGNGFRLEQPLNDGVYSFNGTARLCQSFSHQIRSRTPLPMRTLSDCQSQFESSLC